MIIINKLIGILKPFSIIIFLCLGICSVTIAQDTLQNAQSLRDDNKLENAISLLSIYTKNNPEDWKGWELLAETYYWTGDHKKAIATYKHIIPKFLNLPHLNFGLSQTLIATKRFKEAKNALKIFLEVWPNHPEALYISSTLYYWEGKYKKAKNLLISALKNSPNNQDVEDLLHKISALTGSVFDLRAKYMEDDQPINQSYSSINYSQILSALLQPSFQMMYQKFDISNDNINIPGIYLWNRSLI